MNPNQPYRKMSEIIDDLAQKIHSEFNGLIIFNVMLMVIFVLCAILLAKCC